MTVRGEVNDLYTWQCWREQFNCYDSRQLTCDIIKAVDGGVSNWAMLAMGFQQCGFI